MWKDGLDIALEHGWIELASGDIVDPTWLDEGGQYFAGVIYTAEYLRELDPDFLPLVYLLPMKGFGNADYRKSYYRAVEFARGSAV